MEVQQAKIIGKARGYRDLINVFRAFFEEKQITRETLDGHCGLTDGYSSKLLTNPPLKHFGPTSLTLLLQQSGLELWVVQRADSDIDGVPKRESSRRRIEIPCNGME